MKEQNEKRDCKIVRDLLPNYIEKLTHKVTNEFIEEHIASCEECRIALQDMSGEVEVEEFNQDEEIKYLKRINTKVKMTIGIVSLIVIIIASGIILHINNKSKIQVNNYTFMRAEYVREDKENAADGNIYGNLIAVIDEKGVCKSVRVVEKGYSEDSLKEKSKLMNKFLDNHTNISIIADEIHYNTNIWNKITKKEMIERWSEEYNVNKIEEI